VHTIFKFLLYFLLFLVYPEFTEHVICFWWS